VTLFTGAADIGQGSNTMAAQCAAEVLEVALSRVRVVSADSAVTPKDNGSYSSRVTFMVGRASIAAAGTEGPVVKGCRLRRRSDEI
jgi:4-hydroxybenzoyl-CoA reductase subunit alpha